MTTQQHTNTHIIVAKKLTRKVNNTEEIKLESWSIIFECCSCGI